MPDLVHIHQKCARDQGTEVKTGTQIYFLRSGCVRDCQLHCGSLCGVLCLHGAC